MKKVSTIRNIYFYLASLVTLGFIVGSLIAIITIGLQAGVFTQADPVENRIGPPPSLYLDSEINDPSKIIGAPASLTCEDSCEITEENKTSIETWKDQYQSWQNQMDNPNEGRLRGIIAAISFLIVAIPLYIIHYRIVQKDEKKEPGQAGVVRSSFYYFVALAALIMMVISTGFLINAGLKTWLLPNSEDSNKYEIASPVIVAEESQGINSIINCAESCDLSEDTLTLANTWKDDYQNWQDSGYTYDNTQRQASTSIPYIIIGIPLFWYHWNVARSRKKKEEKIEEVKE
ncbi:MAG: DUF5671 domain-containing protein [bacterium]|nr:DUF5671 domain-containing protein [bacterium]